MAETSVKIDESMQIAYNFRRFGVKFWGYRNQAQPYMTAEDMVVRVLSAYLTEGPKFVKALCSIITNPEINFNLLHEKAVREGIGNRVNWLLRELKDVFEKEGMTHQLRIVDDALTLFKDYRLSLEEVIANESGYRKMKIQTRASPAARYCGVPVVYDFREKVKMYCGKAA